jgi:hypothetical protein
MGGHTKAGTKKKTMCFAYVTGLIHCGATVQQQPQAIQAALLGSQQQG